MVFTPEDLCRVRVAPGPHPTWEMILSINSLQARHLPAGYKPWRATALATARREPGNWRWLKAAAELVPLGNFPDFLTPAVGDTDIEAHFEAILSTRKRALREDVTRTFARHRAVPQWARTLHSDGSARGIVQVLRHYSDLVIGPARPAIHQRVEADRARYARHLLDGGVDGLLHNLHPSIRWRGHVLEADYPGYPGDHTVSLDGRGLLLVPAHFCWGEPVTFIDTTHQPILVCPASGDIPQRQALDCLGDRIGRLAGLVGRTRARLLDELDVGASTTALARRLDVSAAAISQHTKALREAGLITTARAGTSVHHALTPLGQAFLGRL